MSTVRRWLLGDLERVSIGIQVFIATERCPLPFLGHPDSVHVGTTNHGSNPTGAAVGLGVTALEQLVLGISEQSSRF